MMQMLIVVRHDVAPGKDVFEMLRELGVDRHHVFEMAVLGAILQHQDAAVALNDLRLDLADLLIHQHVVRQVAVENLLPDFGHTLGAEGVGGARPAER